MVLPDELSGAIRGLTWTTLPEASVVDIVVARDPDASPLVSLSKVA